MTPERFVLILILLLFSASALVGSLFLSREVREQMARRIGLVIAPDAGSSARRERRPRIAIFGMVNGWVKFFFSANMPHRWGMTARWPQLLIIGLAAATVVALFFGKLLHMPVVVVAACAAAGFYLLPRQILKNEEIKAEQDFLNQFPDAIDMIVRMVRAGMPMSVAIRSTASETTGRVKEHLTTLADQLELGMMFEEAMVAASERVGLPDFRFFAVAVSLQHATGGNIAATLEILSDIIRKRKVARSKARSTTAEVRASAIILSCLPFVVIAGLLLFAPSYLRPLVTDSRGNVIVGVAIALLLTGYLIMRQMMLKATRL